MNDVESEAYLLQAIVYADHADSETRDMIAAWKTGNTERLARSGRSDSARSPGNKSRDF